MTDLVELENKVRTALDNAGYDIAEGRADLFTIGGTEKLIPAFNTCFGNNPAAPYIVPAVPHRPDEAYDYGDSMRSENDENLYWTYRLQENEAIVMFGNLPPEAAFIGYETFLFTRYFDGEDVTRPEMDWLTDTTGLQQHLSSRPDNLLFDSPPIAHGGDEDEDYSNDPNRVILFANGPTINRRTLERQIGTDFWGKQAIFSTSPDAGFKAALDAQLEDGLAEIHAHSPLGADLEMGLTRRDDDFWTLMRYAVPNPQNKDASNAWREDVANQLLVFRVTKRAPGSVVRHPTFTFEERKANTEERYLAADLQKVADAVHSELGFDKDSPQELCLPLSNIPLHAPHTVPRAMSAVGATHDADYRTSSARAFGSEEVFAIVGVNHTKTHNSSYISLGIYSAEFWQGIRGISQGRDYPGPLNDSAHKLFEILGGVPESLAGIDLSKFYVHVLTRPDAGLEPKVVSSQLCTVIREEGSADDVVLPLDKPLRITSRAYLNPHPDASCGPDHTKLLSMILLAKGTGASGKRAKKSDRGASR